MGIVASTLNAFKAITFTQVQLAAKVLNMMNFAIDQLVKVGRFLISKQWLMTALVLWLLVEINLDLIEAYYSGDSYKLNIAMNLAIPITMAIFLAEAYGRPRYWWAYWFGTTLTVSPKKFERERGVDTDRLARELEDWFETTNLKGVFKHNAFKYQFLRKKDASMFKLAWL